MAGHSKWHQIRYKKGIADKKRAVVFSKLIAAVATAARTEQNPQFNPRLRTLIEKARVANVPQDNIDRAVKRAKNSGEAHEELILETYGPEGVAIIIRANTNNKNRVVREIKSILKEQNTKLAEPGSVKWVFTEPNEKNNSEWQPNFLKIVNGDSKSKISLLINVLEEHPSVEAVFTNVQ